MLLMRGAAAAPRGGRPCPFLSTAVGCRAPVPLLLCVGVAAADRRLMSNNDAACRLCYKSMLSSSSLSVRCCGAGQLAAALPPFRRHLHSAPLLLRFSPTADMGDPAFLEKYTRMSTFAASFSEHSLRHLSSFLISCTHQASASAPSHAFFSTYKQSAEKHMANSSSESTCRNVAPRSFERSAGEAALLSVEQPTRQNTSSLRAPAQSGR